MLGFTTTRRLRAEIDTLKALLEGARDQRDKAREARDIAVFNRAQVLRQNATLDEELAATRIVNACLTEDLTAAREQLTDSALGEQMALYRMEKRRADHLQRRLDDALGVDDDEHAAQARRKTIPAVKEATP